MKWQELNWSFVEELEDEKLIEEFETFVGYTFPEDYKACVKLYNGGAPEWDTFDVKNEDIGTTDFGYLYSFNKDSEESIWDLYGFDGSDRKSRKYAKKYIAFTSTSFGDPICFDKKSNHIIFVDHETLKVEKLAKSFSEFMEMLYEE